jgi:acyl-CoA thioester hydrolase
MSLPAGRRYRTRIKVRYAETDQMGFVYYANHLVWFEVARTEALESWGLPYAGLERDGFAIPVLAAHCDYASPARYGDEVEVSMTGRMLDGLRFRFDYQVARVGQGSEPLSSGHTVHVCMGPGGRPRRPHPTLREILDAQDEAETA